LTTIENMKYSIFTAALFAAPVFGEACPFALLKRAGLLSDDDAAAFDLVKRDPEAAESLIARHHARAAEANADKLIGPRQLGGLLDLPLGGGLRKFP
jgi:hypothetical protein